MTGDANTRPKNAAICMLTVSGSIRWNVWSVSPGGSGCLSQSRSANLNENAMLAAASQAPRAKKSRLLSSSRCSQIEASSERLDITVSRARSISQQPPAGPGSRQSRLSGARVLLFTVGRRWYLSGLRCCLAGLGRRRGCWGRRAVHVVPDVLHCLAELLDALADALGHVRQALGAEQEEYEDEDDQQFPDSEWSDSHDALPPKRAYRPYSGWSRPCAVSLGGGPYTRLLLP